MKTYEKKMRNMERYKIINGRKYSRRDYVLLSFEELNSWRVKLTGAGGPLPLIPKFFDKNECHKYKVNHMLSLWKNFETRWVSLSYDAKASIVVRCN